MLLEDSAGKRTRALAASLAMQSLIVGALALIPLLYSDRMPSLQPWMSLTVPLPRALPEPEPVKAAVPPHARQSILPPRTFLWPVRSPQPAEHIGPFVAPETLPFVSDGVGSPAGVPLSFGSSLQYFAIDPPQVLRQPAVRQPDKPHLVGGDVQAAKLLRKIVPAYPALAKQARISGTVRLTGVIAKDGTIQQLQVVSGNPLLIQAALDAVRQWIYKPTLLNGEAVEVIAPIDVIFTLSQ